MYQRISTEKTPIDLREKSSKPTIYKYYSENLLNYILFISLKLFIDIKLGFTKNEKKLMNFCINSDMFSFIYNYV